jgi:hypothetical protein
MTRMIPSWLADVMEALEREALRDPFVSGALHAARAFDLPEREFFLTLVRALSAERERLIAFAIEKAMFMPIHDAIEFKMPSSAPPKCGGTRLVPSDNPREFQRSCSGCADCGGRR